MPRRRCRGVRPRRRAIVKIRLLQKLIDRRTRRHSAAPRRPGCRSSPASREHRWIPGSRARLRRRHRLGPARGVCGRRRLGCAATGGISRLPAPTGAARLLELPRLFSPAGGVAGAVPQRIRRVGRRRGCRRWQLRRGCGVSGCSGGCFGGWNRRAAFCHGSPSLVIGCRRCKRSRAIH